jgi:hypothetical protein
MDAERVREIEAAGFARGQIDPASTGCSYADDFLLPAVRKWGFRDQERI